MDNEDRLQDFFHTLLEAGLSQALFPGLMNDSEVDSEEDESVPPLERLNEAGDVVPLHEHSRSTGMTATVEESHHINDDVPQLGETGVDWSQHPVQQHINPHAGTRGRSRSYGSIPGLVSASDTTGIHNERDDAEVVEVEMSLRLENDEGNSLRTDYDDSADGPITGDRRTRVAADQDQDRDRRHPSERHSSNALPLVGVNGTASRPPQPPDMARMFQAFWGGQRPVQTSPAAFQPRASPVSNQRAEQSSRTMSGGILLTFGPDGRPMVVPTNGQGVPHNMMAPPPEAGQPDPGQEQTPIGLGNVFPHLANLFQMMVNGGAFVGDPNEDEKEDPERAERLVNALEVVPVGLVRRTERVGGAPGAELGDTGTVGCAVCWDKLLDGESQGFGSGSTSEPVQNITQEGDSQSRLTDQTSANGKMSSETKVVVLPCAHVFHASCLLPWFSRPRQTTCPTCRFNIDPDNLTFRPRPVELPQSIGTGRGQQRPADLPPRPGPPTPQPMNPPPAAGMEDAFQQAFAQVIGLRSISPNENTTQENTIQATSSDSNPRLESVTAPLSLDNLPPLPVRNPDTAVPLATFHAIPLPFTEARNPGTNRNNTNSPDNIQSLTMHLTFDLNGNPVGGGLGIGAVPPDAVQGINIGQLIMNIAGPVQTTPLSHLPNVQVLEMNAGNSRNLIPPGAPRIPPLNFLPPGRRPPRPPPRREWTLPAASGPSLRSRVEDKEREAGLRCFDPSCCVGPSDEDPIGNEIVKQISIRHLEGDSLSSASVCTHTFHPACIVVGERIRGTAAESRREGQSVDVHCPVCRAAGNIDRLEWEEGNRALNTCSLD